MGISGSLKIKYFVLKTVYGRPEVNPTNSFLFRNSGNEMIGFEIFYIYLQCLRITLDYKSINEKIKMR